MPIGSSCPLVPPTLDGRMSDGEWDLAQVAAVTINLPGGETAPAKVYVLNDAKFLYMAVVILRDKPDGASQFDATLDADYDRTLSAGDDACTVAHDQWGPDDLFDVVYYVGGECPKGWVCSAHDTSFGGTMDTQGAGAYDGTYLVFEMAKPLLSGDRNDATMYSGSTISLQFHTRIFSADQSQWADTYFPGGPRSGMYIDYAIRDCGFKQQ